MTVKCRFKDDSTGLLPCIMWNPDAHVGQANLWTHYKSLESHLATKGKTIADIAYVEAPIELYLECDDNKPYKHYGLLIKTLKAKELSFGEWENA